MLQNLCFPELGARAGTQKRSQEPELELVAGTGAGQDWDRLHNTGSEHGQGLGDFNLDLK